MLDQLDKAKRHQHAYMSKTEHIVCQMKTPEYKGVIVNNYKLTICKTWWFKRVCPPQFLRFGLFWVQNLSEMSNHVLGDDRKSCIQHLIFIICKDKEQLALQKTSSKSFYDFYSCLVSQFQQSDNWFISTIIGIVPRFNGIFFATTRKSEIALKWVHIKSDWETFCLSLFYMFFYLPRNRY